MSWSHDAITSGPVDYVSLLDSTWQGEPMWGDDLWVALDAPDLVYEGPPFPGLLVRVGVKESQNLRVAICQSAPGWAPMQVAESELIVENHGLYLEVGDVAHSVDLETGNYPIQVWVDPVAPGQAKAVAFVLGPRRARRLPDRTR